MEAPHGRLPRVRPSRLLAPLVRACMIDPAFGRSIRDAFLSSDSCLKRQRSADHRGCLSRIGWKKTEAQYRRYLEEQAAGLRVCWVAFVDGRFAGYVTLSWRTNLSALRGSWDSRNSGPEPRAGVSTSRDWHAAAERS